MGYWKEWKKDCQRAIYELLLSFMLYWNDDIEVNTLEEEEEHMEDTLVELEMEDLLHNGMIVNTLDRRNT